MLQYKPYQTIKYDNNDYVIISVYFDMVPHRLYLVGVQLLFLSHMAQSFILLTANMEDVKKIARKFVSDSLAEKIAELVSKATGQMVTNVSEENEQNIDDNDKLQNIGRQRNEKTTETTEDTFNKEFDQTSRHTEYERASTTKHEWKTEKILNTGQNINWEKEDNEISYEKYSKEVKEKPKRDYDQAKPDHDQQEHDYERSKHDFTQPKPEYETEQYFDQPKSQLKEWRPDYEKSKHDFDRPKHEYEQAKHDYEKPIHNLDQPKQDYEQPKHDYDRSKQDYKKSRYDLDQPKQDYAQPKPDVEQSKHDYDQPKQDYEQSKYNFDKPKHDFVQPKEDFDMPKHYKQPKHDYKQLKSAKKPKFRPHKQNQKINLEELRKPAPDQKTNKFNQNDHGKYPVKNDQDNKYPDQKAQKPRRLTTFRSTIDSTILYAEKSLLDDTPAPNRKIPVHRGHRLTGFDSAEAKPEEAVLNATALSATLRGFNIQRSMTTQKERTEFDQYDNLRNPKSNFIATSGPVALPKVPMQIPWWEKEMPGDKDKGKKLWF